MRKGASPWPGSNGSAVLESKVGQRHVQGRTKAGGQSQQRFARRRDNQARVAFEAAAEHAARILEPVEVVVTGGDHVAVDAVLADPRLAGLTVAAPVPRRTRPAPGRAGPVDRGCRLCGRDRRQRRVTAARLPHPLRQRC